VRRQQFQLESAASKHCITRQDYLRPWPAFQPAFHVLKEMCVPERIIVDITRISASVVGRLGYQQIICGLIISACVVAAWAFPRLGDRVFGAIERFGKTLAQRKALSIALIAIAPIVIRISLSWLLPVPVPVSHDEFSYLLAGDTFAHGRLTNPAHPLWVFFDTIHVNQQPTYMSKYPPAQGAVLALGQLLGNPWFGVVLSVGLMCAAVLWMLQGWLPPAWALLGGALVLIRVGIFTYWMNSYWGGAAAATGGALVIGAMPRIFRFCRPRDAVLLATGAIILANSRPLEGLIFCLPVILALVMWVLGKNSSPMRVLLPRLVLPFCGVMLLGGLFVGYYNWRATGNPALFPYSVNEKAYVSTPTMFWQKAREPLHYLNPQFDGFYNGWTRQLWLSERVDSVWHAVRHLFTAVSKVTYFYLWPELCLPVLMLPWTVTDRRIGFLIAQAIICFLGFLLVPWFQPHYAAPLLATLFALLTQLMRHLRLCRPGQRPVGIALSRLVVLSAIFLAPFHPYVPLLRHSVPTRIEYRARFQVFLNSIPGEHLVIVRYSPKHDVLQEWVYNAADIDRAKTVWAREIPGVDVHPLLDYFHERRVWLAEPDATPPSITPYSEVSAK
jgi:hypothetical protein